MLFPEQIFLVEMSSGQIDAALSEINTKLTVCDGLFTFYHSEFFE